MAIEVERTRRFTADEYERMVELGIFRENERLELIDGEIVEMTPIGHRHSACVSQLNERLVFGVRDRALVWVHGPTRLGVGSVPEPDLALLRRASYRSGSPRPDDILLVIEVAESSLPYDRTTKLRLYARAGVREYWVVSVAGEWIEVYRSPEGDGYRDRRRVGVGERIAPADFADVTIAVGEVFA
jgi:Uma2 family endonuclease